ncbi:MAG TPA: IPT/TIG domain-containing protein [Bacteroidota bacterium]|nr:IPT/TIG domain-containing protein [Bacteroidota bacterium]
MRHSLLTAAIGAAILLGMMSGCTKKPDPSIYDPNWQSLPAPTITSITPQPSALAGVTVITITGTNFSPAIPNDLVYFAAQPATILSATTTVLTVRSPLITGDTLQVTVSVLGSQYFSNYVSYSLKAAVQRVSVPKVGEDANGLTTDAAGNIYASLVDSSSGNGTGTWKFTPQQIGQKRDTTNARLYSNTSGVTKWTGLKMGPGGVLYAARNLQALYRIPAGGGAGALWVLFPGGPKIYDFDFDANHNVWAGGDNANIYRVTPGGQIKAFPFLATCRAFRVYNGSLYVGAKTDSVESVWQFPIVTSDSLGPPTKYFDFSAKYTPNGPGVQSITFAGDGDMYIGTDAAVGILIVHPTGASEPLYPGVIFPEPVAFSWSGNYLFVSRLATVPHSILAINMLKSGAPYYGIQ